MKKNKKSVSERKSSLNRGSKRGKRVKETQSNKFEKKKSELEKKKHAQKAEEENFLKILESRNK